MACTIDEVYDDLLNNADFEELSSVTKARAFATAAKRFLILSPQQQTDQGSSMTISVNQIENLLRRAQQFIEQSNRSAAGGSVRFLSAAEGFRR
jgi:hypothetical protein